MKHYCIFLKKELFESVKTFKLLVMGIAFLFFGMLSPLTAKFTPEILKWAIESDATIDPALAAALAAMPKPTALNPWAEFYSNMTMGMFVLVIVFSGMLASELSRGTLTIILTKGISRANILLSKATCAALIWTGSLAAAFLTCLGYTVYLFPETVPHLLFAIFTLWMFGLFLLAATTLFAALTSKGYVCMVLVGAFAFVLSLANIIPKVARYNPITLSMSGYEIITEDTTFSNLYPALIICGVSVVLMIITAVTVFNKSKL